MHVLSYWLSRASSEQLYELGSEFVRTAWERDNPQVQGKLFSEIKVWRELAEPEQDGSELQAGQKWVA